MIKKVIKIDVDTLNAQGGLENIDEIVNNITEDVTDLGKTATKSIQNIEKATEETAKSTKSLSEGFKGIGLALKGLGLGIIISGLNALKDAFMSNQKVADTFNTVMTTVGIVFNKVIKVIVDTISKVSESTKGFEGLKNVISGLLTIGITPLKLEFYALKLAIDSIRLAWEDSIFGDKDPKKIKELTKNISDTKSALVEVGYDAIKSGKQVFNNLGKAGSEITNVVKGVSKGISDISVSASYDQAKAFVQLQNNALIAEAKLEGLVEQYDRQAEKLRQTRDEERNTIDERIKANNELGKTLNNQESAMKALAKAQIASAKANYEINKTKENEAALIRANNKLKEIEATVEGFRSEQKMNELQLNKELNDLNNTRIEQIAELAINEKKFNTDRIKDEENRIIAQKKSLQEEKEIELNRLQIKIDSYNVGTQLRADAEKEYALKKQELDNQIILKDEELNAFRTNKAIENQKKLIDNENFGFASRLLALEVQNQLVLDATTLSETEKTKIIEENARIRMSLDQQEYENKKSLALQSLEILGQVFQENKGIMMALFVLQKAVAISDIVRNASQSIAMQRGLTDVANAQALLLPFPANVSKVAKNEVAFARGAAMTKISAGIGIASILAQSFGQIKGMNAGGGGGGNPASASAPATPSPQFNLVNNSGVNQIATTLAGQQPVKAYVVAKEVTTAQELDRNKITSTKLG